MKLASVFSGFNGHAARLTLPRASAIAGKVSRLGRIAIGDDEMINVRCDLLCGR
jgi:hypothetical protein